MPVNSQMDEVSELFQVSLFSRAALMVALEIDTARWTSAAPTINNERKGKNFNRFMTA